MITAENLSKVFVAGGLNPFGKPARTTALDDVTFEIGSGETVALVGRNGSGKTTLLKILSTLILPDGGNATVGGLDVAGSPRKVREIIGVVNSDERSFYWRLTGAENLYLFGALYDIPRRELRGRVVESLRRYGLAEQTNVQVQAYSAGMKQRLSLARGLLHKPSVLLMDEPGRSADPVFREEFFEKLQNREFNEDGRTVFFATHSLPEAVDASDRVLMLDRGRIVFFDRPGSVGALKRMMSRGDA